MSISLPPAKELLAWLDELPELQREVLVLRHLQGWTIMQIAERLHKTPAAVGDLLVRAGGSIAQKAAVPDPEPS